MIASVPYERHGAKRRVQVIIHGRALAGSSAASILTRNRKSAATDPFAPLVAANEQLSFTGSQILFGVKLFRNSKFRNGVDQCRGPLMDCTDGIVGPNCVMCTIAADTAQNVPTDTPSAKIQHNLSVRPLPCAGVEYSIFCSESKRVLSTKRIIRMNANNCKLFAEHFA